MTIKTFDTYSLRASGGNESIGDVAAANRILANISSMSSNKDMFWLLSASDVTDADDAETDIAVSVLPRLLSSLLLKALLALFVLLLMLVSETLTVGGVKCVDVGLRLESLFLPLVAC